MRVSRPILIALSFLALSCGTGAELPSFSTAAEAAEAGAAALASGKSEAAAAAFKAAAGLTTDAKAKASALQGLFQAQLEAGKDAEAIAALGRMVAECRELITPLSLNELATLALNRKNVTVADAVVNKALELFPAQKDSFAKAVAAVDLLKTQGAGADLSSLGYTGD